MICHETRSIFIHLPKNGGQSIEHVFLRRLGLAWETRAPLLLRQNDRPELGPPSLAHLKARDYVRLHYVSQALFEQYFKFTFVRNPFARAVSIYKYFGYDKRYSFKTFAMRTLPDRLWREKGWFVGPQVDFLCDDNGELLVDFVGKFEDLQADFNVVCSQIGLPPTTVPHVNNSSEQTLRFGLAPKPLVKYLWWFGYGRFAGSHHAGYAGYYDAESRARVAELYRADLERFGYTFEAERTAKDLGPLQRLRVALA